MLNVLTELLQQVFLWIYCLPWAWLAFCFTLGALLCRRLYLQYARRPWWQPGAALLLLLWALIVVWSTILSREPGAERHFQSIPFHSYREVFSGGSREILRSSCMNVILFFPAGLLLAWSIPHRWRSDWVLFCGALLFFCFSLTIEVTQYRLLLGQGEIDDVLHNTLGSVLGILWARLPEGSRTRKPQ